MIFGSILSTGISVYGHRRLHHGWKIWYLCSAGRLAGSGLADQAGHSPFGFVADYYDWRRLTTMILFSDGVMFAATFTRHCQLLALTELELALWGVNRRV